MKNKTGRYFLLGYLGYSVTYLCRFNLSTVSPLLEAEGRISAAQYGLISGGFLIVYSLGRLINGYIGDKLDTRKILALGLLGVGVCNLLLGFSVSFLPFLLLWLMNGYAQSMLWGPLLDAVTRQYPQEKSKYAASLLVTSVAVGSVAGIGFAAYSSSRFGLNAAFFLPGLIAISISAIMAFAFHPVQLRPRQPRGNGNIRTLWKKKGFPAMVLTAAFHGIIKDNLNTWIPIYFAYKFQTDISSIAYYVFAIPLMGLIGRLLYPLLYHVFRKRELLVPMLGFGMCALSGIPLVAGTLSMRADAVLLCVLAASISIVNTSIISVYPMEFAQQGSVSTVSGFLDFATYMGAGLSALVFGLFVGSRGYSVIFYTWIVVSVISVFVLRIMEGKKYETVN